MRKIEIENVQGVKKTFELKYNRETGEEGITELHGFTQDFRMNLMYERSPFQQGATTVAMRADTRPLSFILNIFRKNTQEVDLRVQEVVRFMNPYLGPLRITYDNGNRRRSISAYYVGHTLVEYEDANGQGTLNLELMADDALFEDEKVQTVILGSTDESFIIPFTVPFTLGTAVSSSEVINTGDYYYPVELTFYGPLLDPELIREVYDIGGNLIKTDRIKFVGLDLPDFWKIRISTEQGAEECTRIDPEGNEENINRFLSPDSTYWQIFTGRNIVKFSSATGNPTTEMRYRQKYITA